MEPHPPLTLQLSGPHNQQIQFILWQNCLTSKKLLRGLFHHNWKVIISFMLAFYHHPQSVLAVGSFSPHKISLVAVAKDVQQGPWNRGWNPRLLPPKYSPVEVTIFKRRRNRKCQVPFCVNRSSLGIMEASIFTERVSDTEIWKCYLEHKICVCMWSTAHLAKLSANEFFHCLLTNI